MEGNLKKSGEKTVAMFAPTPTGGHALYTEEVMAALNRIANPAQNYQLITSRDLDASRRNVAYAINDILPPLKLREHFHLKIQWALSRLLHYFWRDFLAIIWLTKNKDARVVHMQEFSSVTAWAFIPLVRFFLGRRVGMTVHNIRPHSYPILLPKRLVDGLNRFVFSHCEFLIVHSEKLRVDLAAFVGASQTRKIHVAPHGVWTFRNIAVASENDERPANALFFGTIRKNKGLDVLLESMTFLADQKIGLVIAGYPDDAEYFNQVIKPRISELREKGYRIKIIASYIEEKDLPALFASARVLVLPYKDFSAQSGVLFNAIAFGLPVVATSAGALGETVEHFHIGVTVEESNPREIAAAVESILLCDFEKTFSSGFEAARADLDWNRHAEVLNRIYE